jgi:hypothetical protein
LLEKLTRIPPMTCTQSVLPSAVIGPSGGGEGGGGRYGDGGNDGNDGGFGESGDGVESGDDRDEIVGGAADELASYTAW